MLIFALSKPCYEYGILNSDGQTHDLWTMSITTFSSLLVVLHNKLLLGSKHFDVLVIGTNIVSILLYIGYI